MIDKKKGETSKSGSYEDQKNVDNKEGETKGLGGF